MSNNKTIHNINEIDNMKFIINEVDVCQILMRVHSDNIVHIHKIYETFSKIYIIMDYIPSGSLEDLIEKNLSSLSISTKYYIASQLVSSIHFLHSNNIMHRDVKAGNILVDKNFHIYLIDYGFSMAVCDNEYLKGSYGTLCYAPPEMYKNKSYNKSIDIWSLGVTLYYLLYGRVPFAKEKDKLSDVVYNIFNLPLHFENSTNDKSKSKLIELIKLSLNRDDKSRVSIATLVKSIHNNAIL